MMAPTSQSDWRPSDWPDSLQELQNMDNLLRCTICFEYFRNAVSFQECSHTYCSLCIRIALVHKKKCPTCSMDVSANDLRCNRVLNELVKNFVSLRERLLDIVNGAQNVRERNENEEISDDSVKNFEATPRRHRLNTKSKIKKRKSPHQTPKRKRPRLEDSDSENHDDEEMAKMQTRADHQEKSLSNTSRPTDNADATASSSVLVKCPVCEEWMSPNAINNHIDLCLVAGEKRNSLRRRKKGTQTKQEKMSADSKSRQGPTSAESMPCDKTPKDKTTGANALIGKKATQTKQKKTLAASKSTQGSTSPASASHDKTPDKKTTGANALLSVGKKRAPIPGIVYAILSEKQIKQKLKEWNLSTKGDRKTLIKRHQEFVVVYNAECDSVNPKPVAAIVKELEMREKRNTSNLLNVTSTGTSLNLKRDASEEEVDKVHKQYLRENKDQFEKLIDEIRKRKKQGRKGNPSTDKFTRDVIFIDDLDSEQEDKTESKKYVRQLLEAQNQESSDDSSVECLSSKIQSRKQQSSSLVVDSKQTIKTEHGEDQTSQQCQSEDARHQNKKKPFLTRILQQAECSTVQKNEMQVLEPPLMSNLASLSESDSSNNDDGDDEDGTVVDRDSNNTDSGGNGGGDDDDDDETQDNDRNDQDWE